ncbi:hypothetical protein [Metabacillus halosaccharovorans]|uniref:hypothetical protein n=1 Tax=Metabacillus halosaccharovorans TaxID=930124 RepID=UPI000C80087A|nr:hypothetical protein [Metabacillus halosaccharovorans]MBU7595904.1 hypothetical protein [Metabacillus halosaccharovorans]PMC36246.1 hypothetical protein CJ195_15645 [Bacillus sp. UMB0899]
MQDLFECQRKGLIDLIVAALISNGEISRENDALKLSCSFNVEKSYYLLSYLKQYSLQDIVYVNSKREQITIISPFLVEIYDKWYEKGLKKFSFKSENSFLTFDSIITSINLFGERKVEGVSIFTTTDKRYLKNLAYSIEKTLGTTVFPTKNIIKIPDFTSLFLTAYKDISVLNSAEMSNFLTNQEKKQILKEAKGE